MNDDKQAMCTTSGRPVEVVRAEQTESTGQHKDYIVLCPDERAKGFVRPYRDSYKHVGQSVCGNIVNGAPKLGGPRDICAQSHGHEGECGSPFYADIGQPEYAQIANTHCKGGCGIVTMMGRSLSETYARDPSFYGATFCVGCNKHLPVGEFIWTQDGEVVGS